MIPQFLFLSFSLLLSPTLSDYPPGYRPCGLSSSCCFYQYSNHSIDFDCTSQYCFYASPSNCHSASTGYRRCSSASGCCFYLNPSQDSDFSCSTANCFSASAEDCTVNDSNATVGDSNNTVGYPKGYRLCSSGCCNYTVDSPNVDFDCSEMDCKFVSPFYCLNLTEIYPAGYRNCSFGCCFYKQSSTFPDLDCVSRFCSNASILLCQATKTPNKNINIAGLAIKQAEILSQKSGKKYIVVDYSAWLSFCVVGSTVATLWCFYDVYLIYQKCFYKPEGWTPVINEQKKNKEGNNRERGNKEYELALQMSPHSPKFGSNREIEIIRFDSME